MTGRHGTAGETHLTEAEALQVHSTIGGQPTALGFRFERALRDGTRCCVVPVTSQTVYSIEGLWLLASEHGLALHFDVSETLSEREHAFLDDFITHRVRSRTWGMQKVASSIAGLAEAFGDVVNATVRAHRVHTDALPADGRLPRAVLIGAYGGDHVGDAAILGGVLQHLHAAYGTTSAVVLSFRPEHTRRLSRALETPVQLQVASYTPAIAAAVLDDANALVIAGGPLMDLPRVLVKHLAAVSAARARGVPLIIERVGIGPFNRRASRWAARRVARSATLVSVRTVGASKDPILEGIDVTVRRDPAFDYLATRTELTRLTHSERASVSALLEGVEGHLLVGINLRPIRHAWSSKGEAYSKASETHFFDRFARGMVEFSRQSPRPVTYLFFPMNPLQFGASDLASAFRLHRLVGAEANLRVWEADPDVDGVVRLLRQLHIAVTMRFHACIFALAQKMPVIGVDYYPGQGGKVEELFTDLGLADDVRRIDTFEADWLVDRLHRASSQLGGKAAER